MDPKAESIRELLLSRLPEPANLKAYREEVAALVAKNEKGLRREKAVVLRLWIFVVVVSAGFLAAGGMYIDTPKGPWFGTLACFWFLFGAVETVKHFVNRGRVELLKEVKQVQLQVLELQTLLSKSNAPTSGQP